MKLYTTRGDHGQTDLFGGQSAPKDDLRIHAIGQIDELNAFVGHARCVCSHDQLTAILNRLQHHLFELGADLACPHDSAHSDKSPRIGQAHIRWAESTIDELSAAVPAMKHFILPGGSELASRLHIARGVCRRAERTCVALAASQPIGEHLPIYINRVSDLLFAMARSANQAQGVEDIPWINGS